MTDCGDERIKYDYRSYIYEVVQPKKHQITAKALRHLQNFIREAFLGKKEIDRSNIVLSSKEKEVFELLAKGLTTKETAKVMNIQESTVQGYTSRVYGKYGVNNREDAIARFLESREKGE